MYRVFAGIKSLYTNLNIDLVFTDKFRVNLHGRNQFLAVICLACVAPLENQFLLFHIYGNRFAVRLVIVRSCNAYRNFRRAISHGLNLYFTISIRENLCDILICAINGYFTVRVRLKAELFGIAVR